MDVQLRSRGRPKLRSDEEQMEIIVDQARRLFVRDGFGSTTVDEVAKVCRISKRTLYRLFPSKIDLFAAMLDRFDSSVLDLSSDFDTLPLAQALERVFRLDIDDAEENRRRAFVQLVMVEVRRSPELGIMLGNRGEQVRQQLAGWIERQQRRGRLAVDDSQSAARALMDMVFGAVAMRPDGTEPSWPSRAALQRHLRLCLAIFARGVAAGKPRRDNKTLRARH
jgi:AcrR family transcriptional regulator